MLWKEGMTNKDFYHWLNGNNYSTDGLRSLFGIIPAYPLFMFLGICIVILASVVQLKRKNIPLRELEIGILIVVPIGIIGGSFFGKIFLPNYQSWTNFYKAFFFWQPGMSFFGSIGLGIVAGFGWFYLRSKETQISMWVYFDLILVNVLLGQAIGRWGNLYNQEILGWNVSYDSISWMPDFIKHRLFSLPSLGYMKDSAGTSLLDKPYWFHEALDGNGNLVTSFTDLYIDESTGKSLTEVLQAKIQFKAPLFLIEGICNVLLWVFITFGVKNLNSLINRKNNPWTISPETYPCFLNKEYKTISEDKMKHTNTLAPIKYKKVTIKNEDGTVSEVKMSLYNVWNKAYYWVAPDLEQTREVYEQQQKWELIKQQHKKRKSYKTKYTFGERYLNVNPYAAKLESINNPNNYNVIRCGLVTGTYILGYGLIRIILEIQRTPTEYMIPNHAFANFFVQSLIILAGVFIIVVTQFISPYKWREAGWLYEKSY